MSIDAAQCSVAQYNTAQQVGKIEVMIKTRRGEQSNSRRGQYYDG